MKKKKILALTVAAIIGVTALIGCKSGEIKRQLESGITALNNGQYDEAKEDFEEVIKEDENNVEAKNFIDIINNYENAKKEFEKNDFDKAKEYISKIPEEYTEYKIKDDIDNLKNEVDKKEKIVKEIDDKLKNIDNLIKGKKYIEAKNIANKLDIKDGLKEQKEKLDNLKKIINERLEEIKRKEAEEKIKKEREEAAKKKALEEKKALEQSKKDKLQSSQSTKNNNESANNIHYVNKQLGLQMEVPAAWRGRYEVHNYKDGMEFIFVADNGEVGILFLVEKDKGGHSMFDDTSYKTIDGVKYIMGKPTDVGMNPENPQYKLYRELKKQTTLIKETIRSAK